MKDMMMELLNNPAVWAFVLMIGMAALGMLVKKTKTKKDDQIYAMILHAFNLAEKVTIPGSSDPDSWQAKTTKALDVFKSSYVDRYGTIPPDSVVEVAKDHWNIIANEVKKS